MIAIATLRLLKIVAALIAAYLALAAIAAAIFMGDLTYWASFVRWLWGMPVLLVALFAFEWGARRFMEWPALQKASPPVRISVGVVTLAAVAILVGAAVRFFGA